MTYPPYFESIILSDGHMLSAGCLLDRNGTFVKSLTLRETDGAAWVEAKHLHGRVVLHHMRDVREWKPAREDL